MKKLDIKYTEIARDSGAAVFVDNEGQHFIGYHAADGNMGSLVPIPAGLASRIKDAFERVTAPVVICIDHDGDTLEVHRNPPTKFIVVYMAGQPIEQETTRVIGDKTVSVYSGLATRIDSSMAVALQNDLAQMEVEIGISVD